MSFMTIGRENRRLQAYGYSYSASCIFIILFNTSAINVSNETSNTKCSHETENSISPKLPRRFLIAWRVTYYNQFSAMLVVLRDVLLFSRDVIYTLLLDGMCGLVKNSFRAKSAKYWGENGIFWHPWKITWKDNKL